MIYSNEPEQPGQENWKFVKELAKAEELNFFWTRKTALADEADLSKGVTVENCFPVADGALDTAFEDLYKFFDAADINMDGDYKVIFEKADTACFEAYSLDVRQGACRIQAADTEGIRRAVYYLEDLLLGADGAFLPLGVVERKPWLKNRISRCFFGPIKRPPFNRDELADDVDYYPDEYLNRLAHEGINGLWLTIAFRDLCKTSFTELQPGAEKRLAKLRRTVDKCLRYGIKTYIFCIEPRSMPGDDPLLLAHPELKGALAYNGNYCFCPFSEVAQQYIFESTNWIFTQVPGLGGMINISFGERPTTCLSSNFAKGCKVCSKKSPGEILAASLKAMERGMHAAAPDTTLISWLYVPQNNTGFCCDAEMLDVAEKLPENIVLQYNFESGGGKEQLGKYRHAGDYWLSYTGPCEIFAEVNAAAIKHGNEMSAKIQVACSHEVATVPEVPVPGLLYRKYKKMRELGVSQVMQCWYFGNYPGIMNKAAGELAFEEFTDSEQEFMQRLARSCWGKHSADMVKAWQFFADGYANYPLDNMFQYYGPEHDGVVWPLYLKPADKPLAPTWRLDYGTSGDRYGECFKHFTIDEVMALCRKMTEKWHCGMLVIDELRDDFKDVKSRIKDIILVEALDIQFNSGNNILKFYSLRDELLDAPAGRGLDILKQMRKLVEAEIENSSRIAELCRKDSRLGFHPEAEGYKYFPEKLEWRIEQLQNLLETDFAQAEKNCRAGRKAFAEKSTKTYICNSGKYERTADFAWKADYADGKLKITIDNFEPSVFNNLKVMLETQRFNPPQVLEVKSRELEVSLGENTNAKEIGFNIYRDLEDEVCSCWVDFKPCKIRLALGTYDVRIKGKLLLVNE